MARGGRRAGTKGGTYTNRSDLRTGPLPLAAPRGLPYGERQQLIQAQRAVPLAPPSSPAASGPASQPPPSQAPVPGATPLLGPTMRPNEPVTAGLPLGAGPGPEVLQNNPMAGRANVADTLSALAQVPGAPSEVGELANYAKAGR